MTGQGATSRKLVLYGAPDCHLCHEAMATLRRVQRLVPFEIVEVNIREHPDLADRFGLVIPVIEVGGQVIAQSKVTEFRLLRHLHAILGSNR